MDQSNMNTQSQYPDPELNQIQNTPWIGQPQPLPDTNPTEEGLVRSQRPYPPSLLDWQKQFRRSFDPTPISGRAVDIPVVRSEGRHIISARDAPLGVQHFSSTHETASVVDWQSQFRRSFDAPKSSKDGSSTATSRERPIAPPQRNRARDADLQNRLQISLDPSMISESFDTPMTGMEPENGGSGWGRELPGDDVDDFLDGEDDPDYRDHATKMKKLRNDILQLRHNNQDVDFSSMLDGTSVPRPKRKGQQPKEPRPRGRQLGQKVGPRKAAELSGDIKLRLARAVTLFNNEQEFEAAEALEEIIRLNAEVPVAWLLLAGIYEDARQIDRALRCMIMAAHTSPKSLGPWINAAIMAESQHGPERMYFLHQAQFCYSAAIRIDPKSLECRRARAAILEERGKRNNAISEYKTIAAREPADTETLRKLAELCIDHGKPQVAIDTYKESIAYFKSMPLEHIGGFDWTQVDTYVTLYEVIGQYYSAISELKSLSRWLLGREEDIFWNDITGNDCEWDIDESRKTNIPGYELGKHVLETYELPLELRVKLGLYRLWIENYEESMHHLHFLDPQNTSGEDKVQDYPHLFHQVASELFKKNKFEKALIFFEPLLNVPDYYDSALLVQVGRCLLQLKQDTLAEQTFRDAIELNDNDVDARMELAKIHEKRNELHKALNFVNEAMLLRKGQKRRETVENQNKAEGEERVKKKYRPRTAKEPNTDPKIPKTAHIEANKRLQVLSKGEELINHYQTLRGQRDGMRAGDSAATTAWLEAAKALTDDFRSCKAFYPWDKYIKFLGYSGESALHAATPLDSDLTAIADRLAKNLGADVSLHKKDLSGSIPTTYRDLAFTEWMDIFTEYAISLAKNGFAKDSYEICHSIEDAVVFYQTREDKFLTHLVHAVCALISSDEEACVTQARFFMREYQFTTDSYRMYGALMRAIHSPVSWYSSGPSQKYILRQIKCMDLALIDDDRRKKNNVGEKGSYSATDDRGHLIINDDMDICLLMMYGHILYVGQSYAYALNYFLRAYALDQDNAMINLCIGLSYCHHALKRQCENRQHHILQGMSFMMRYHEARIASEHLEERQEAHYNVARIYHMLGLVHLALPYYQKVLDEVGHGQRSEREDIVTDTAYNLQIMYAIAGNMDLAREVTRKWLVI